jgi:signal peptidase I
MHAPPDARALFHLAKGHFVGRAAKPVLVVLFEPCGVDSAQVGDLDGWLTDGGEMHFEIGGAITADQVSCLFRGFGGLIARGAPSPFEGARITDRAAPPGVVVVVPGAKGRADADAARSAAAHGREPLSARLGAMLAGGADLAVTARVGRAAAPLDVAARTEGAGETEAFVVTVRREGGFAAAAAALAPALRASSNADLARATATAEEDRLVLRIPHPSADLALALRRDVIEAFRLPSGSMIPTLLVGDHVFVLKDAASRAPERGAVVAFAAPGPSPGPFIKRVVAVAGDRVAVRGRTLLVNDVPATLENERPFLLPPDPSDVPPGPPEGRAGTRADEHLFGRAHPVLFVGSEIPAADSVVPPGHVYVLGDNRNNSHDSRAFGPVPATSIKGRVAFRWFASGADGVDWARMFEPIE